MTPAWDSLPQMPGHPELRQVDGTWMDRAQFDAEGWRVVREYTRDDGTTGHYWKASLEGIQRYAAVRRERKEARIASAQARDEHDAEFTAYINALDDAKPGGRP